MVLPSIDRPHTARAFYDEVITRHGFPRKIITDGARNILGALFTELNQILKIRKLTTIAYRPQYNGHVEDFNDTLVTALAM